MSEADRVFLEFEGSLTEVRRLLAVESVIALEAATPKKTTFAASGWRGFVGELPPQQPTPNSDEVKLQRVSDRYGRQQSSVAALSAVRRGGAGVALSVINDTAYIGKLNQGSSSQAPAGFIQATIAKVVASVQATVAATRSRRSGTARAQARRDFDSILGGGE